MKYYESHQVNLRGNKPLLLDKVIYKEHPLSKKIKNNPIYTYNPKWTKNTQNEFEKVKNNINNQKMIMQVNNFISTKNDKK